MAAYEQAKKNKRFRNEVLIFTNNLEENIIEIQNELIWKTYQVGKYREFFVYEPKKRLVMALPFKDRVVQWAIYRQLNPLLEKRYINTSYACRNGYGTHRAVKRLQTQMQIMRAKSETFYVLKLDISKYFYRVDHDVLMNLLRRITADKDLLYILEKIIRSENKFGLQIGDHAFIHDRIAGIGIPIGNLTSQMIANLYLNELDQFAKHNLGVKHYVRYMDDVCIVHTDKKYLWQVKDKIEQFLATKLKLVLNNKTEVRTANQRVDFCGYRVWPTHIKMRKKSVLKMKRHLRYLQREYARGNISIQKLNSSLQSYLGLLQQFDCYQLKTKLLQSVSLTKGDE